MLKVYVGLLPNLSMTNIAPSGLNYAPAAVMSTAHDKQQWCTCATQKAAEILPIYIFAVSFDN